MSIFKDLFRSFKIAVATGVGKINWKTDNVINAADLDAIRSQLKDNYYIILTRHDGHLSTYAIALAHFLITGKWGYYSHVLLNIEDKVTSDDEYEFLQSTAVGVKYAKFAEVFDQQCGSVALLKPRGVSIDEWTDILDRSRTDIGKPYDLAMDPSQTVKLNCVELVRDALKGESNYATDFTALESTVAKYKALDPQMIYECEDFEIVWEGRISKK
jgi:hypothetical protein